MRNGWLIVAIVVGVSALGVAMAQQVKRTETGTITADLIEYDFSNNDCKATGNVTVSIDGRHQAKMFAPALFVDLNQDLDRILSLVAEGPVKFEVLTAPDSERQRRKIVASCGTRAAYDAAAQTIVMSGGAKADVSTLPTGNAEAAHFTGDSIGSRGSGQIVRWAPGG
jgi:lipopolysaccharide export system protein LptA